MNTRGTVLIIDDDRIVADVYRLALEMEGWHVRTAIDGVRGWAAITQEPALALVIADLALPGATDGIDLVERLRAERPEVPALVSSGWVSAAAHERLDAIGVTVLQKPVGLDALATAVAAAAGAGRAPEADGARPRVLVADDDPSIRATLARELTAAGYAPVEARDGAEAFERALARPVEAALIDLRMPRLDGVSGIRALHQLDPGLTVIVITADSGDGDLVARALSAGAMACLAKPLDLGAVRKVVDSAVQMTADRRAVARGTGQRTLVGGRA